VTDRPRALVITPDFPPAKGGIQTLIHRVVSSFERLDATVVTLPHPEAAQFDREQDFAIRRVHGRFGIRSEAVLRLNAKAVGLALRQPPDVLLSGHIVAGPTAAFVREQLDVPFLQYVYAKEVGARPGLARFALTRADRVVAISAYSRELAITAGAESDRIALIHPGVDMPAVAPNGQERSARPTLITVARLEDRYKGHDVVLKALPLVRAQVPDVLWQIVGDGPLRPSLEDRVSALGLSDVVEFLGGLSDRERDQALAAAHVFCMVSRLPAGRFAGEGFGIVYLEASIRGLPIVAGEVGGATDAVIQNETGLLVDPEDHVAVADALVTLLRDRGGADRMGRNGKARAHSFGWPAVGRRVESELLALLK
jgi:phosphatidylinositol alpha-1,6-mannosyltransferase